MIEIINLHGRPLQPNEIYIGRESRGLKGSPLGNPFSVGKYGREGCIEKYRVWLWHQLGDPASDAYKEIHNLAALYVRTGKLTLACWCKPEPCHGDVVARAIEWRMK